MVTISRVVEKIVEENVFIQEALSRGIINYAALAEEIKPRVEIEMNSSVKESAVMMALRRLAEKLEKSIVEKPRFSNETDIFVKSDLYEITVKKSKKTFALIKELYDHIDSDRDFLTVTQGITQVTLITNKRNKKKVLEVLKGERIFKEIDDLSSIGITIPIKALDQAGYFYIVTKAFAWENISIVELVSTLTEMNLIIKEKDVPKAFIILKKVIEKNS